MAQYVYTMNRVGKIVPPKRQILKDINLSFFPGAKIGVLGLNGSGKSTLLKIMAGLDKDIEGEAVPMPGLKIGYLPQEPQLDPTQNVREAVEQGIGGVLAAKARLDEVYAAYAEPDADFDKLAAEQAELESIIAAAGSENTDLQLEIGGGRTAPSAVGGIDRKAVRRREATRRTVPAAAEQARHAAAGRAHQPPRRRDGGVAGDLPETLPGYGGRHHPRPLLLDNAAGVDSRTRPRPWASYKGNCSDWVEQKETRLEQEQKTRTRARRR